MNDNTTPPPEVHALARERALARRDHDWARADALKERIEGAGWKVIDSGSHFTLVPATPPTVEVDGAVRYGHASAVPSVLGDAPDRTFTVVVVADYRPAAVARLLAALRAHAPAGTQVVVVADAASAEQVARLAPGSVDVEPVAGEAPEVVWTSERLGVAAALNAGLRRARGSIVVFADGSVEPVGDALTPLAAALADEGVAVAGPLGYATRDLRTFDEVDGPEAAVIGLGWLAFRRADAIALGPGPLDEKFSHPSGLGTWWSLVLRDGTGRADGHGDANGDEGDGAHGDGPESDEATAPCAARRVALPVTVHDLEAEAVDGDRAAGERADRLAKRNHYRILDRFRGRADLLSGS